ncbi:protein GVQW3-like [Uloborus diversus]|uniref:protein GVQW3-like n=1 Tax=Uloborus diversus TaxID=327109 RepID=UPI00240A51AC|nr:protein GVQW3-like [Uloborus diversus]
MDRKVEQRVCVKLCVKLGKSFVETFQMLQDAFDNEVLSRSRCHEWFKRFKEGRTSTTDDPRSGRPSTSTDDAQVAKLNALVRSNRRLTIREMAEECHISFGSCQEILTEKIGDEKGCSQIRSTSDDRIRKRTAWRFVRSSCKWPVPTKTS